jgi:hypothetical protein
LERFYDPESGVIKLDGVDIKSLDPSWYRQHIGIVTQVRPRMQEENKRGKGGKREDGGRLKGIKG